MIDTEEFFTVFNHVNSSVIVYAIPLMLSVSLVYIIIFPQKRKDQKSLFSSYFDDDLISD